VTTLGRYVALVKLPLNTDAVQAEYQLIDGQVTWLIFILGAVIGSRAQVSPSEAYDALDADLICRALDLMRKLDEVLVMTGCGSEQLNVAFLNFLQHFRLSFIGDTVPKHGRLCVAAHSLPALCTRRVVRSSFSVRTGENETTRHSAQDHTLDNTIFFLDHTLFFLTTPLHGSYSRRVNWNR
jgi:hypothetical protein